MSERLEAYRYWQELRAEARHMNKLSGYGFSVCSMHDQDGMLDEIFRRIETKSKRFIEFGCGEGMQNNTLYRLSYLGWKGLWIDGDAEVIEGAAKRSEYYNNRDDLDIMHELVDRDNIDKIISDYSKDDLDYDLLVIDVDWNDSYIWEAIECIEPRVICIEYNSAIPYDVDLRVPYNKDTQYSCWNGASFYGSSLLSLNEIATKKGYSLVGCSLAGSDAFFVRDGYVKSIVEKSGNTMYVKPMWFGVGRISHLFEPSRFDLCFNLGHQSHPWSNVALMDHSKRTLKKNEEERLAQEKFDLCFNKEKEKKTKILPATIDTKGPKI